MFLALQLQDQDEWQIEWQTALVQAGRVQASVRVSPCSAWSEGVSYKFETGQFEMVRRRSTVRFRKGAPSSGQFFERGPADLLPGRE